MWTPERIRELRDAYGETQEVFATHFGLGAGAVRVWEQGRGKPSKVVQIILAQLESALRNREPAA